ncbi:MAG TPA: TetR/AcrR family transcriptional regulator [Solirubrobacteraceae bacterium]|jgi:AcrR family transcriptional regulator
MSPASTLTRTRLSRELRMEQTLAAARTLFAARGYGTVTMDEVAAAVGVTKPLLYNYFGNKERLYLACMEPAGDALLAAVVGAIEQTTTPEQALRSGIHAFFEFVDRDRSAWRVLFDETLPVEGGVARRVGEYRTRITDLVAQSLLAQLSPAYRVEIDALSTALLGAAEALVRWWLRTESLTARAAAELLITTVEPGLHARVEAERRTAAARSAARTGADDRASGGEPEPKPPVTESQT